MKIFISLERFKKGLGAIEKIAASKSTLPILNNVLIKVEDNQVVLTATDLEVSINYYLGGKVDSPGSITVPSRVLINFINNLNEKKINLEVKDNVLLATTEKSEASINGISAEEFPIIPKIKGEEILEIKGQTFKTAINQVGFATSFDESRPVLTGVYFAIDSDSFKIVATDSYRLAEKILTISSKKKANFIVPNKTIQELHRVISGTEDIKIVLSENQVMFVLPDMEITSRIIEGEYPDYEQIIPKNFKTKAVLATHELANTIKTASFFAKESANNVKILFKKDLIDVEATSSQLGSFKSQLKGLVTGDDNEINFNAKYILDALNGIESDEVELEVVGKLNPGVIKPVGGKDGITYIIMPLRS